MLGQFQQYARWQIGPYENEYRKENGRWKISSLHWYETFTVPYQGGWKGKMEATNVADRKMPNRGAIEAAPELGRTFRLERIPHAR